MHKRPHRFLQYLAESAGSSHWYELPALYGGGPGSVRVVSDIKIDPPGRVVRDIRRGVAWVLKWTARMIYLAPLLIIVKLALLPVSHYASDMTVVVFVLLVLSFFVMLNLYVLWSLILHFAARGHPGLILPFDSKGAPIDPEGFSMVAGSDMIKMRGRIRRLESDGERGDSVVIRDLWVDEADAPWRMVEVEDFAVVAEDRDPLVLHFPVAPLLFTKPRNLALRQAMELMSKGLTLIFDTAPALKGQYGRENSRLLILNEGDEVEILGTFREELPNVERFELDGRVCSLSMSEKGAFAPYRGVGGQPGSLVAAYANKPVWIRKL